MSSKLSMARIFTHRDDAETAAITHADRIDYRNRRYSFAHFLSGISQHHHLKGSRS